MIALTLSANAKSTSIEVSPEWMKELPWLFEVNSKRLGNGDTQFAVRISPRTQTLPVKYITSLGIKIVVEKPGSRDEQGFDIRELRSDLREGAIQ
jgi:hypothetical protein